MSSLRIGRRSSTCHSSSTLFDIAECLRFFFMLTYFLVLLVECASIVILASAKEKIFLEMRRSHFFSSVNDVGEAFPLCVASGTTTSIPSHSLLFLSFSQHSILFLRSSVVNILPTIRTSNAYCSMPRFHLGHQRSDAELNNDRESVWSVYFALALLNELLLEQISHHRPPIVADAQVSK